jgi:hypothetical protein
VAWFDSGELAAAATSLGVPHPTGFAAFVLAGHDFAKLPLGPAALRVHLLGATCAVAAVALWRRALAVPWPADARQALDEAAVCLAPLAVGALAMHIRASEVYAPTWLIAAASLYAVTQTPRATGVLALLTGLGAAVHVEAALVAGIAWMFAEFSERTAWSQRLSHAALLLAGLATLTYLPLAAARNPLFSWGDIDSLPALWRHLSAASIREAFADRIGSDGGFAALGAMVREQALLWLAPAVLGLAVLWRRSRRLAGATLALLGIDALYSALVNPMGLRDQQAGLLLLLGVLLLAAEGLVWLLGQVRWPWTGPVLLVAIACQAYGADGDFGQSDLMAGARYADVLGDGAGPGQLSVTASDHAASACLWRQVGEGARPDAPCIPAVFERDDRMAAQQARVWQRPNLRRGVGLPVGAARLEAWLAAELGVQPIRWEVGLAQEDRWLGPRLQLGLPWGKVAAPGPQHAAEPQHEAEAICRHCSVDSKAQCPLALRKLLSGQLAVLAGRVAASDRDQALHWSEAAVAMQPTAKALNNLAGLLLDHDPLRALQLAERALALEPDYLRAHRQAARAAARLGDRGAMTEHLRVLTAHPNADLADFIATLHREAAPELQQAWPK